MNSATLFFLSMHKNIFISFLFPYHYTKNFHLFHVTVYNFNAHTHTHTHTHAHTHTQDIYRNRNSCFITLFATFANVNS